ncbi:DUTP diphosphatase domain protein [Escherichia coli 174750]|nr:DUTP diphosphatase domain protein [Escherichia coli 174750]
MQGIFERVEQVSLVEVDELDETERGAGGFGSTSEGRFEIKRSQLKYEKL